MEKLQSTTDILDSINEVSEIRNLSTPDLMELCEELRWDLINRVNQVGGHFASSLGVTELTVALHYAFNTPHDKLVWDVGHQAYVHKILTGRREQMAKVRTLGGISGFPKRDESKYDTFGVAHAGTSISAALGMLEAQARLPKGNKDMKSVAIIGDGAMTSGMAFEALNHAGHIHKNLIVILNDNEMSIAPNVGALSWAFSRAVTNKFSTTARKHFKTLTEKGLIPKTFYRALDKAEEATQGFFSTPAMLFGAFGFRYLGPVDGHNMEQLLDTFERAKNQDGPVLIHVLTTKGKGYQPAEDDPVKYHAISANQLTKKTGTEPTIAKVAELHPKLPYTKVFSRTMLELCKADPLLVGITAAMPDGTGLKQLSEEMPERFYDVGIAEQHAVTFAAGLACEGIKPVCAIYSTFLQRAYDQVIHDVCIQNLPVIFTLDRAGLVGSDGPTHHGVFDLSYLRALPNMCLMAPADEAELRDMLYTATQYGKGPIALRYPRGNGIGKDISESPKLVEIGKSILHNYAGEVLASESLQSGDVAIIAIGSMNQAALGASKLLSEQGISSVVCNARFIKPLDTETITHLSKLFGLIVTVEDNALMGGFGSAVGECLHDFNIKTPLVRLGIPDNFIDHGTQEELYNILGLTSEGIKNTIIKAIQNRTPADLDKAKVINE